MVKNPKRSLLSVFFGTVRLFRKFVFSPKGSSFNCNKNVDNFGSVPLLAREGLALAGPGAPLSPFFWFFEKNSIKFQKKNFKVFFSKKVFCAFSALDMAPTLDVLVLFEETGIHVHGCSAHFANLLAKKMCATLLKEKQFKPRFFIL